jgi:hypothetical protein
MTATGAGPAQLSPEMIQKIIEFANTVAWKQPDLDVLQPELSGQYPPIAVIMQEHPKRSDHRKNLILPDLRAFGNEHSSFVWRIRQRMSPLFRSWSRTNNRGSALPVGGAKKFPSRLAHPACCPLAVMRWHFGWQTGRNGFHRKTNV